MASAECRGGHRRLRVAGRLHHQLAQRNADHGSQIVGDNALPAGKIERLAGIGQKKFGVRAHRFFQDRMRNRLVVEQRLFLGVAPGGQPQFPFLVLQKNICALGPRQLQRDVEHGHQNFVEHARGVQLARRFQKQRELFQVGGFLLDLNAGNLAEEFPRSIGSSVRGIEQDVSRIASPELQAVAALQFLALDSLSVDERAVLAAQIDEEEFLPLLHDLRVVARDARVGDHQIFIDFPSHRERRAVQDDVLLLAALHKHKGGKHTGAGTVMTDCAKGHEWSFRAPFAFSSDG